MTRQEAKRYRKHLDGLLSAQDDAAALEVIDLFIHNGYAEKISEIQTDIAVIKNDIKTLYKQKGE